MAFFVDTSVWSLAYRRDSPSDSPHVAMLRSALLNGDQVVASGVVLLELLRGFVPERAQQVIRNEVGKLPFVEPRRDDYIAAAELGNRCRRSGVQLGTIDSLIAQLCIREDLVLLSADADFRHAAEHMPLQVWLPH